MGAVGLKGKRQDELSAEERNWSQAVRMILEQYVEKKESYLHSDGSTMTVHIEAKLDMPEALRRQLMACVMLHRRCSEEQAQGTINALARECARKRVERAKRNVRLTTLYVVLGIVGLALLVALRKVFPLVLAAMLGLLLYFSIKNAPERAARRQCRNMGKISPESIAEVCRTLDERPLQAVSKPLVVLIALALAAALGWQVVNLNPGNYIGSKGMATELLFAMSPDTRTGYEFDGFMEKLEAMLLEDGSMKSGAEEAVRNAWERAEAGSDVQFRLAALANRLIPYGFDPEAAARLANQTVETLDYSQISSLVEREWFGELARAHGFNDPETALKRLFSTVRGSQVLRGYDGVSHVSEVAGLLFCGKPLSDVLPWQEKVAREELDEQIFLCAAMDVRDSAGAMELLGKLDADQRLQIAAALGKRFSDVDEMLRYIHGAAAMGLRPSDCYPYGARLNLPLAHLPSEEEASAGAAGLLILRHYEDTFEFDRWYNDEGIVNLLRNPKKELDPDADGPSKADPATYKVVLDTPRMDRLPLDRLPETLADCGAVLFLDTEYVRCGTYSAEWESDSDQMEYKYAVATFECRDRILLCDWPGRAEIHLFSARVGLPQEDKIINKSNDRLNEDAARGAEDNEWMDAAAALALDEMEAAGWNVEAFLHPTDQAVGKVDFAVFPRTLIVHRLGKDAALVETLSACCRSEGYDVQSVALYEEELPKERPDLILLDTSAADLTLPEEYGDVPVIRLVSERDGAGDSGAATVLKSPLDQWVLTTRMREALYAGTESEDALLSLPGLELNLSRYVCLYEGQEVHLSRKELETLYILGSRAGTTVSNEELMDMLWKGGRLEGDTSIPAYYVKHLQEAFPDCANYGWDIRVMWGKGYQLRIHED